MPGCDCSVERGSDGAPTTSPHLDYAIPPSPPCRDRYYSPLPSCVTFPAASLQIMTLPVEAILPLLPSHHKRQTASRTFSLPVLPVQCSSSISGDLASPHARAPLPQARLPMMHLRFR